MTKIKRLKLYRPHPGQRALHESGARFRVAACGRRWGKTLAATAEMIRHAWESPGLPLVLGGAGAAPEHDRL